MLPVCYSLPVVIVVFGLVLADVIALVTTVVIVRVVAHVVDVNIGPSFFIVHVSSCG